MTSHESADDVVNKAMSVVNWNVVTEVETATFGTTLGMMREAEVRLRLHNTLFNHKCAATVLIVVWSVVTILAEIPTWIAVAAPATGMLFDVLWCCSRRTLIHGIVSQYREELLVELRSLSERYPATQ
jgi:hypothetical protein